MYFNSLDEDIEWNRIAIENSQNIIIENCKITGFRHISELPNAWGLLISNSSNIDIINCEFENNSQSEIAIVENTQNILIEKCTGKNLSINFEPNNEEPIKDVIINS